MHPAKKRFLFWFPVLLWAVLCFILTASRAPYGVDVTDESFYIAEAFLLTQGGIPLADIWSQTPLTGLLIAPMISLYTALTGGTEGILLYMQYVTIAFRAAVAIAVWLLLRPKLDTRIAAMCALLLFSCDMGHTKGLNYNNLSLYLLVLAGVLLYNATGKEDTRGAACRYAAAGLVMALCALAHVTQVFNCLLFAVLLLFLEHRSYHRIPLWLIYSAAGMAVAVIVTAGLELASGGGLLAGLRILLRENNYFRIGHVTFRTQLSQTFDTFKTFILLRWLPLFLLSSAALSATFFLRTHSMKRWFSGVFTLSCLAAACGTLVWIGAQGGDLAVKDRAAFVLFVTVPLYLLWMAPSQRRTSARLMLFFWVPCLVSWLLIAVASHSSAQSRYYILTFGAALTIPFAFFALRTCFRGFEWETHLSIALPYLLGILFSTTMFICLWTYVYRDAPVSQMTYRVQSGTYKGCYTLPERGKVLETLEKDIKSLTNPEETVLFSDLFPMGYLMTDAHYCTPTTWDPCMYRYGFQDAGLFLEYFTYKEEFPDKIIYVNSEGRPLSIDDPENQFAAFVNEYYTLTDTVGEGLFSIRVFSRNKS